MSLYVADLYPLPYIGGHQEKGQPNMDFRFEDGVVQVMAFGPKGARRLNCQVGDQAVLALAKWFEMAAKCIYLRDER